MPPAGGGTRILTGSEGRARAGADAARARVASRARFVLNIKRPPAASWMLSLDHGIEQNAAVTDLDADLVAGLEKPVLRGADAGRAAGRDHIARPRGDMAAEIGNLLVERIDHVLRAAVLAQLPVDPELDAHVIGVGHELGGRQPRPHRHRVAEAF